MGCHIRSKWRSEVHKRRQIDLGQIAWRKRSHNERRKRRCASHTSGWSLKRQRGTLRPSAEGRERRSRNQNNKLFGNLLKVPQGTSEGALWKCCAPSGGETSAGKVKPKRKRGDVGKGEMSFGERRSECKAWSKFPNGHKTLGTLSGMLTRRSEF
ncbi:MAG: hypothetical protein ACTS5A_01440 [Candidatus Hodgkinia cicadicola]